MSRSLSPDVLRPVAGEKKKKEKANGLSTPRCDNSCLLALVRRIVAWIRKIPCRRGGRLSLPCKASALSRTNVTARPFPSFIARSRQITTFTVPSPTFFLSLPKHVIKRLGKRDERNRKRYELKLSIIRFWWINKQGY